MEHNTFTNDYFARLVPDIDTFDLIFEANATYRILNKDEMIVQESSFFVNDFVTHSFALISEGGVYERQCHRRSICSPEVFNDLESPQHKAACWLMHDDPQNIQPEQNDWKHSY